VFGVLKVRTEMKWIVLAKDICTDYQLLKQGHTAPGFICEIVLYNFAFEYNLLDQQ
jgi:hypothetical protein